MDAPIVPNINSLVNIMLNVVKNIPFFFLQINQLMLPIRMAEVGSLLARPKMAIKAFVKHIFTIFATNASFLHVIANLTQYNM